MEINNISSENKKNTKDNKINVIKGSVISIVLTIIFLTVYAILLCYTNISEKSIIPVVIVFAGISILIGSSISARKLKEKGMINGGIIGLIYILFIYILSSSILMNFQINTNSIIMIIVSVLTGMIGGIIGINIKF